MDHAWLNLVSADMAVVALGLPVLVLGPCRQRWLRRAPAFTVVGMTACGCALSLQLFYGSYLVGIEDWSALMDLSGTVSMWGALLLAVCAALHAGVLVAYHRSNK